jgi:hypothetical protein
VIIKWAFRGRRFGKTRALALAEALAAERELTGPELRLIADELWAAGHKEHSGAMHDLARQVEAG